MANRRVTLIWRCKTEKGWERFRPVMGANGRPRKGWVMAGDPPEERHYPEGRFQLRFYEGSKALYKDIGPDANRVLGEKHVLENLLSARDSVANTKGAIQIIEDPERRTLAKAYAAFLQATEDRGSKEAKIVYKTAVDEFLNGIPDKTYVDELTAEDMLRYQRCLRQRGVLDRTVFNRWANTKAFLLYCGFDPKRMPSEDGEKRRLAAPKYEEKTPEIYESEEMKALFPTIIKTQPRLYTACQIMLKCGLRDQEMQYLEWKNISLPREVLHVRGNPHYDFKVKDHEQRDVPVPESLVEWLREYRAAHHHDRLVCPTDSGEPNTKFLRTLKRAVRRAGLNCGICEGCAGKEKECYRWYLHKLRATCVTLWLRPVSLGGAALDLRTVMKLSGHATLESVMRYLSPASSDFVRRCINGITYGD